MNYRRGLGSAVVLLGATLLFVVAIVALVLLVAVLPDVVFLAVGLVAIGAILLYLFVRRGDGEQSGGIRWQY